jgi:hypothetical protein
MTIKLETLSLNILEKTTKSILHNNQFNTKIVEDEIKKIRQKKRNQDKPDSIQNG